MNEQFGNTETVVGFGKNGQKRGCEWIFLYIMGTESGIVWRGSWA